MCKGHLETGSKRPTPLTPPPERENSSRQQPHEQFLGQLWPREISWTPRTLQMDLNTSVFTQSISSLFPKKREGEGKKGGVHRCKDVWIKCQHFRPRGENRFLWRPDLLKTLRGRWGRCGRKETPPPASALRQRLVSPVTGHPCEDLVEKGGQVYSSLGTPRPLSSRADPTSRWGAGIREGVGSSGGTVTSLQTPRAC